MKGKRFVGLVLTEQQAEFLHALLLTHEIVTVRGTSRVCRQIRAKIGKSLDRLSHMNLGRKV